MRHALVGSLVIMMVGAGLAAACGDASNTDSLGPGTGYGAGDDGGGGGPTPEGGSTPTNVDAGVDNGINTSGKGAGTGAATGLPCDVQQLLENRCIGCHLGPSPKPLLTYADLTAPSSTAGKSMAQQSLVRMQSTTSPMPPAPAVAPDATEIKTFSDWVTAGTPMGMTCTSLPDGGVDGGSTPTNYNTPTVCTSNKTWNGGTNGSASMQPGAPCITCHTMQGGPAYKVAGTVYPTAHEPNECNGVNGPAGPLTVVVTDANNTVTNIPVNAVGNFYSRAAIVAPFHVKVTDGVKTRAMAGSLTAGDCNSCHTLAGANGAPGRVMAP
jgi:hypothetical protein